MKLSILAVSTVPSLVLGFSPQVPPPVQNTVPQTTIISESIATSSTSSMLLSESRPPSVDDTIFKSLEKETREVEKLAKKDQRKAQVEKSREAFFEYEAKMAEAQEARIEAAEQKAIDEAIKDKKEFERLRAQELKIEEEAARAGTKAEKEARLKEAQRLVKAEKKVLQKEKKAERAERVFLAEEIQEQQILQKKEIAARNEEEKFEKIEKEYERVEKLAEEDEAELRLAKKMMGK